MRQLALTLSLLASGCVLYGPEQQYKCTKDSDCIGTAFSHCDTNAGQCASQLSGNTASTGSTTNGSTTGAATTAGITGTSASGTTGAGTTTGSSTTTGATSGGSTTAGLFGTVSILTSILGAPIKQLVPTDAGIFAVGTSLWFSDGGAWTEVLDVPSNSLLELAENDQFPGCDTQDFNWPPYDGFSLQRLLYEDGVLFAQVDTDWDAGRASNFYVECPSCGGATPTTWTPLRTFSPAQSVAPITSAAVSTEAQGSFFVFGQQTGSTNPYVQTYTYGALFGAGMPQKFDGGWFECGAIASDPNGPAVIAAFSTTQSDPLADGRPAVWLLGENGSGGGYFPDASIELPAAYVPSLGTGGCANSGAVGPVLAVALDAGLSVAFVGGSAAGGGVSVWAVPFGWDAGPSLIAKLPAGALQLALGPGGLWMASGRNVEVASLTSPFLSDAGSISTPDAITALGALGKTMLAGTGNGITEVTAVPTHGGTLGFVGQQGLAAVELDVFVQGASQIYALSGSATRFPSLWTSDGGGLQLVATLDGGGPCREVLATSVTGSETELVICGQQVYGIEGSSMTTFPYLLPESGPVTFEGLSVFESTSAGTVFSFTYQGLASDTADNVPLNDSQGPVYGPVWASPSFATESQRSAYAYGTGGEIDILDGTVTPATAISTSWAPGSRRPSGLLVGAVDPLDATQFVIGDAHANGDAGELLDCAATAGAGWTDAGLSDGGQTDAGIAGMLVNCRELCAVNSGADSQVDVQFDSNDNLWALSHITVGTSEADLLENRSHVYFLNPAQRADGGTGICSEVPLSFVAPPGQGPLQYTGLDAGCETQYGIFPPAPGAAFPFGEGLLGFGVVPSNNDGGIIYFRGTRHPLVFSQP